MTLKNIINILQFTYFRIAEYLYTKQNNHLPVSALRHEYIEYCKLYGIDLPAAKNKMGQAIARIMDKPDIRQQTIQGDTTYYYKDIDVMSESERKVVESDIILPGYFSMAVQRPYFILSISTGLFFDQNPIEYKVYYNFQDTRLRVTVRGIELDLSKNGLASCVRYFDQAFIKGIDRSLQAFTICKGQQGSMAVQLVSKIISRHSFGFMDANGKPGNMVMKWFSKNCRGVLPLTCSLDNHTCRYCVHDVNIRLEKLTKEGRQEPTTLPTDLSVNNSVDEGVEPDDGSSDDEEDEDDSTSGGALEAEGTDESAMSVSQTSRDDSTDLSVSIISFYLYMNI